MGVVQLLIYFIDPVVWQLQFDDISESMQTKHRLFMLVTCLLWWGTPGGVLAAENFGLGPLEIRDQFPVTMPFLSMTPENTQTLKAGEFFFSYQLAVANTFLNSAGAADQVDADTVERGLVPADFFSEKTGLPVSGFHNYIDVESYRHLIKLKMGFTDFLEFGIEFPFVSFVGGSLDIGSEAVHNLVGIDNDSAAGAYRTRSDRNRYDFYVLKEDTFVISADEPFENEASDVVFNIKWNLWEGSDLLPAVTAKFSYKSPIENRNDNQRLVSSGEVDFGSYLLLSKRYGDWIVYLGLGSSNLGESGEFSSSLRHRFMAFEFQLSSDDAWVFQAVSQSSIYRTSGSLIGSDQQVESAALSRVTDLAVIGYKSWFGDWLIETGFVEDFNQFGNQTDIVLFFEIGQRW